MTKKMTEEQKVQKQVESKGFPEVGAFKEKKDLQGFYKHLTTGQLAEWVALEGLEAKETDDPAIYRMRLAMKVLYLHFPKPATKPKSKRKYEKSTEEYVQMAIDAGLVYETSDDERILRMRTIMALRATGHIE